MSSVPPSASERKTIGVFTSQVGRAWGSEFIAGITDAAESSNVNVVHFIGGILAPIPAEGDKLSLGLYDLAKPEQFDGLILTADVAFGVSPADLIAIRKLYGSMPLVTQSVDVAGAAMFIPNNAEGMIADDLNISLHELQGLAAKGPNAEPLLYKMLGALGVDRAKDKHLQDPLLLRDLQRICFSCADKKRCVHELKEGTARQLS